MTTQIYIPWIRLLWTSSRLSIAEAKVATFGRFWLTEEECCVAFWVSVFCQIEGGAPFLSACRALGFCELQEAGGRRRSVENEHLTHSQTFLSGSWPGPGVLRRPTQAFLSLQAFLYRLLPSKRVKRLGGAFPVLGTFPKSPLWAEKPGGSSRAKKG